MTFLELAINSGLVVTALAGLGVVYSAVNKSGRDRPHDPERIERLLATAPYEGPDNILSR